MAGEADYNEATTALVEATSSADVAVAVDGIMGFLQGIEVDEATINAIVGILESSIDGLGLPLDSVPSAAFGGAQSAAVLAHHTDLAHDKVREAMKDMVTGLTSFRDGVDKYVSGVRSADEISAADSTGLLTTVEAFTPCLTQPDVTTNNSCPAP
ncbi:hypothetical protein [Nocardioides lijunqiniae]|uniref:hypothetical protein n=1 Tax=Nocardioides lijunqiniae TaxID=2760832 RepID=UPI0018785318|nr:hypothetical protein [Nocardioides lijunqiniae]